MEEQVMNTLRDTQNVREYTSVLETLDRGSFWSKEWASRQYLGLVITAMCRSVVDDEHEARRFAVMRVLEVFLEHLHNLQPAGGPDYMSPRQRVAALAIPNYEEQCKPWLDVLEYMQLQNWTRKGIHSDPERVAVLRTAVEEQFSPAILAEVDAGAQTWWVR